MVFVLPVESLPFIAGAGYQGVEIMVGPKHVGTLPEEIDAPRREALRELLATFRLEVTALHLLTCSVYRPDDATHRDDLERVRAAAQLARDLGVRAPPVIAMGFGARTAEWDGVNERMVSLLSGYGDLAEKEDFVLAGEAHRGAAVDRSERITWLLDQVDHPRVKLHFDIVHTFMGGEVIEESVETLLPYTAHTHWTDAKRTEDGGWQLVMPGWGEINTTRYVSAMHEAGWNDFITVELSGAVWSREDFDPLAAARHCCDVLTGACRLAGVPLG